MKLGVLSDVHGNLPALEAVLDALEALGADEIWCAGDLVGYYPRINECIALIRDRCTVCIEGNHDAMLTGHLGAPERKLAERRLDLARASLDADHARWLAGLPGEHAAEVDGRRLRMLHGSPDDRLEEYVYPDDSDLERFVGSSADLLILGHTHWPMLREVGGLTLLNPGSCGQPRDPLPGVSFAVVEAGQPRLERVSYDVGAFARDLAQENHPGPLIEALWRGEAKPREAHGG